MIRPGPRLALLPALALIAAAGCVSAPPPSPRDPGVDVPDTWTALEGDASGRADPVVADWVRLFEDPVLPRLVDEALEHNRDLRAAAARVRRAAAAARVTGADRLPQVGAGLRGSRQRSNFFGLDVPGAEDGVLPVLTTTYGVSLDVAWEADLWGRLRARERAALADQRAALATYRGARLSVAAQTAKAWFAAAAAAEQRDLAARTLESYRETLAGVERRYRRGLVDPLDVRLTRTEVSNAEALLATRERQLSAAARQLEILLGRYPAAAVEAPRRLPDLPDPVPAGLPAELVGRRPDVVAARLSLAAADSRVVEARRALYPSLSLTASGGTSAPAFRDLLDGDFSVWSLVANLTQPIFQGGRLRANVDVRRAESDEALAAYAGTLLAAYGEVENALAAEQRLAERERALRAAEEEAAAAERLAREEYRSGLTGVLSLLESQRRALASRSDLISVRRERLLNRIDLHLALGGGFAPAGDLRAGAAGPGQESPQS